MKDDSGLTTLVVIAVVALVGVVLWRRGVLSKIGNVLLPPPGPTPPPGIPVGPTEYGAAAPGGGSAYGRVCNEFHNRTGQVLAQTQDPRAQAVGVVTQIGGPLFCAGTEYVAGKAWDGTKWVAANTASTVKSGAKSVWNNTLGKLF